MILVLLNKIVLFQRGCTPFD
uniref:Uncharacterized protein n=1 Tax=Anguilla anguilla TaxID=7936 RepID=A0A0E9W2X5_ANGAN